MLVRPCSFAGCLPRILGGLHFPVLVIRQGVVVLVPWRAGAEAEGEEEEGHLDAYCTNITAVQKLAKCGSCCR